MFRFSGLPFALTTSEWIDLGVATGTLALAGATFWMARGTAALARTAQAQHEASITPLIRVQRISQPDKADICIVNEGTDGEALTVPLENLGPTRAEVETFVLTPLGSHSENMGLHGKISDPDERFTPDLQPGEGREFDFEMTPELKDILRAGERVSLRITYLGIASGLTFHSVEHLRCTVDKNGDEDWRVLGSEGPRPL